MARLEFKQLLDAGVHFGHLKRKWNPNMAPYIFDEKKGIHIIDLNKTAVKLEEAAAAMKSIARGGKKVLFVATKKQAKDIVTEKVKPTGMPYVTERWSGGMLTNFGTIRRTIKKMATIDRMKTDGTFENMSKRERLQVSRQREKMEKNLGSIADLTRLPSALFIVDIVKEHIAVAEAKQVGHPHLRHGGYQQRSHQGGFPDPRQRRCHQEHRAHRGRDDRRDQRGHGRAEERQDRHVDEEPKTEEGAELRSAPAAEVGSRRGSSSRGSTFRREQLVNRTRKAIGTECAVRYNLRPRPKQHEHDMAITAADVNKLRQMTGAGMMDCKKALTEANGDFDTAIDVLRKQGQKVAANRADRDAAEGLVIAKTTADAPLVCWSA
jgi:ribosomal protein S2